MTLDPALGRKLREAAERITTARTDRDRLVIQAYEAGASLREIAFELGVPYDAYIPFMEQPAKWSSDQEDRTRHEPPSRVDVSCELATSRSTGPPPSTRSATCGAVRR